MHKRVIKIVLLFLVLISFLYLTKAFFLDIYQDFNYYYYASQAVFQGINPYLPGGLYTGYIYPPIDLVFLYPFQLLPLPFASKAWIALSLVSLFVSLTIILRVNKQVVFSTFSLSIFALAFLFFPIKFTLGMGQINIFVLLCLSLAIFYFAKQKEGLSGIFFGLAITVKYFPLFIIPYLILRKKWKILKYLVLTIIVFAVAGFLFIDPKINTYFYSHTFVSLLDSDGSYYYNQALSGFLARLIADSSIEYFIKLFTSLVLLAITFILIYKNRQVNTNTSIFEIGIVITVNLLLNAFAWQHHFTWLLIPLISTAIIVKKKWHYLLLLAIFILLTVNIKNPASVSPFIQSHAFYGALLLWGFDLYLLHKINFKKISKK